MTSEDELCPCADSALHLYEGENIRITRVDAGTIDHISCFKKRATVECIQLLDGPVCIDNSKAMTLLVVIYQTLVLAIKKDVQFVFDEKQKICQN